MGKGPRLGPSHPEAEWTTTECPALVHAAIWAKVRVRMRERATGHKARCGVRRYLLSGLLICGKRWSELSSTHNISLQENALERYLAR